MKKMHYFILLACIAVLSGYFIYKSLPYSGELVMIRGTNVFHRSNCSFVKNESDVAKYAFVSNFETAAEKQLRPCKTCNPIKEEEYEKYVDLFKHKELWKYIVEDKTRYAKLSEENKKIFKEYAISNNLLTEEQINELENLKVEEDAFGHLSVNKESDKDKVAIVSTSEEISSGIYEIFANIENKSDLSYFIKIKVYFYDSSDNLLKTQESQGRTIGPNEITTFNLLNFDHINKIKRYECKIEFGD